MHINNVQIGEREIVLLRRATTAIIKIADKRLRMVEIQGKTQEKYRLDQRAKPTQRKMLETRVVKAAVSNPCIGSNHQLSTIFRIADIRNHHITAYERFSNNNV